MPWTSRKLGVTLLTLASGSVLAWFGHLDAASAGLLGGVHMVYMTANVVAGGVGKKK